MSHDFAKIRPQPLLEKRQVEAPPAWSLMATGILVGISIGVLACFLLYMSGTVPPLVRTPVQAAIPSTDTAATVATASEEPQLELEFYEELREYEVPIPNNVVPVPISEEPGPDTALAFTTMLQTGAFQQQDRAYNEMARLQGLGLQATVKQESPSPGRILFLVQTGPYDTRGQLSSAERLLRSNNIRSMRLELR
ncbi:MAG: SPOR domain-containing protein [Gammaproteobacteria bacterium]